MGTYTTNYNLFMPSIGEQGWGDLVNGNFTTIDTTMKGLDARIGTLEIETDAITERVRTIEEVVSGGDVTAGTVNAGLINGKIHVPQLYESGTIKGLYIDFETVSLSGTNFNGGTFPLSIIVPEAIDTLFDIDFNESYTISITITYASGYSNATCGVGFYDSDNNELWKMTRYNYALTQTGTLTVEIPLKPSIYYFKSIGPVATNNGDRINIPAISVSRYIF